MKKQSLALCILIGLSAGLIKAVEPISDERIEATVASLEAQDSLRTKVRLLSLGAAAVGSGYYLYNWWKQPNQSVEDDVKLLKNRVNDLQERLKDFQLKDKDKEKPEDKKPEKPEEDKPWYSRWANSAWNKVKGAPSHIPGLVKWAVWANITAGSVRFFKFLVPVAGKAGDYLFLPHTTSWFLDKEILFRRTVGELVKWIDEVTEYAKTDDKTLVVDSVASKQKLSIAFTQLIRSTESILGYMRYVTKQVPEDNILEIRKSEELQATIRKVVTACTGKVDEFLKAHHTDQTEFITKALALGLVLKKLTLIKIISSLEDFDSVQNAAGYNEHSDVHTFKYLRALVAPEDQKLLDREDMKREIMETIGEMLYGMGMGA
jgi:hypothetical protein